MGRKPAGDAAMTNAERQARYRENRAAAKPVVHHRRPKDRRPRPQQWRDAVTTLVRLKAEYADWLANMPETLEGTAMADALHSIEDLDLTELEAIEPPKGYGRD